MKQHSRDTITSIHEVDTVRYKLYKTDSVVCN